ncbi:MAG: sulfurtransferase [Gammaproteobacteria bacterium RBG_16_57_12]|nr:MAG: sulfurtransferase [Gammaproteobacteria bacterium RBG_16_57_12]
MKHVDAIWLRHYLEDAKPTPLLLDVREPWEYDICRIDGSQLLPLGQIPLALAELGLDREIVVICHHGVRSVSAGLLLERAGCTRVINLSGGIHAWAQHVDTRMASY